MSRPEVLLEFLPKSESNDDFREIQFLFDAQGETLLETVVTILELESTKRLLESGATIKASLKEFCELNKEAQLTPSEFGKKAQAY